MIPRPPSPVSRGADSEQVVVIRAGQAAAGRAVPGDATGRPVPADGSGGRGGSISGPLAPAAFETPDEARLLDTSVRAHERTHQLALGPYAASGVQLTTRRGADGEAIAVGGRIKADLGPVPGDPRATLRKANAVRRAALAVGSPSAADMRVAAEAYRLARRASEEIAGSRVNLQAE
ncbi:MAG TPA: putative metalloprotease CJM1_0395 family protein [Spirochaetia bacterium]|nr:putative metalloprotease CJM1_0395 family protein [Spirochaetia bacterium]